VHPGEVSQSSAWQEIGGFEADLSSWIQGHPEYGFGFKALVCHDGVRGFSHLSRSKLTLVLGL
jgi:hypothetical protein